MHSGRWPADNTSWSKCWLDYSKGLTHSLATASAGPESHGARPEHRARRKLLPVSPRLPSLLYGLLIRRSRLRRQSSWKRPVCMVAPVCGPSVCGPGCVVITVLRASKLEVGGWSACYMLALHVQVALVQCCRVISVHVGHTNCACGSCATCGTQTEWESFRQEYPKIAVGGYHFMIYNYLKFTT